MKKDSEKMDINQTYRPGEVMYILKLRMLPKPNKQQFLEIQITPMNWLFFSGEFYG
ncbi:hypothetical protein ACW0TQ_08685 [Oceanobacillus sp. M60]